MLSPGGLCSVLTTSSHRCDRNGKNSGTTSDTRKVERAGKVLVPRGVEKTSSTHVCVLLCKKHPKADRMPSSVP